MACSKEMINLFLSLSINRKTSYIFTFPVSHLCISQFVTESCNRICLLSVFRNFIGTVRNTSFLGYTEYFGLGRLHSSNGVSYCVSIFHYTSVLRSSQVLLHCKAVSGASCFSPTIILSLSDPPKCQGFSLLPFSL